MYGLQTAPIGNRKDAELEAAELRLGVTRIDKPGNEDIRETDHIRCFGDNVSKAKQMVWICSEDRQ